MVGSGISMGELEATIKRQEIIAQNVEDAEERFMATNIVANLKSLRDQLRQFATSPNFSKAAEEWAAQEKK